MLRHLKLFLSLHKQFEGIRVDCMRLHKPCCHYLIKSTTDVVIMRQHCTVKLSKLPLKHLHIERLSVWSLILHKV